MRKQKKLILLLGLCIRTMIPLVSCVSTGEADSEALFILTQPEVNIRRLMINQPLQIVLHPQIQNEFTNMAPSYVPIQFIDFRKSIADALVFVFKNNFSDVVANPQETGSGLELPVTLASLQPDNALKFHSILVNDGNDVADTSGTTTTRIIAITSTAFTYVKDTRNKVVKPLTEETIDNMCSSIYDRFFRGQDLEDSGFWDNFN